jgi:hypothetical protein
MHFLIVKIHMTTMARVSAKVSILNTLLLKCNASSGVLSSSRKIINLDNVFFLLLHYWYSLSEQCFLFTATLRIKMTL